MSAVKQVLSLISNGAATGSNTLINFGGMYAYAVDGTFSGATVKLQLLSPDGASWMDIDTALALTAEGVVGVDLPSGATVRATVSGGPPSAIYATLSLIRQ